MVVFNSIIQLWKKDEHDLSGLVPSFDELTDVRKYVPYLKDFKFNWVSLVYFCFYFIFFRKQSQKILL